jgi:hypothetical protein
MTTMAKTWVNTAGSESARQVVSRWTVIITWSLLVAAAALVATMLAMRVTEVGPHGRLIFVAAAVALVSHQMPTAVNLAQRIMGKVSPRFSLRTLLVGMAVCGIGLGWLGNRIRDVRAQRRILDEAFSRGFSVSLDDRTRWMYQRFSMNGALAVGTVDYITMERRTTPIRGDDFEALFGLRYKRLSLNCCLFTDDDFTHLKPYSGLKHFDATSTALGDKAVQHLTQFQNLEDIDLRITQVTDDGIQHLPRLGKLRSLILIKTAVTDHSVASLKSMKQLRYLFLHGTSITPKGVAELRLALSDCDVDDSTACKYPPHYFPN